MKFPHVNEANKYARDVVSGKIPSCKWVRLACQRQLDDLKKQRTKDFPYYFDKKAGELVCDFVELLPHTKGEWGGRKELIKLESWQKFQFVVVFGWKRVKTKTRRFKEVFELIPRKNGKSIIAAAVGNYMMTFDQEYGAEVYAGATTEKQAWEVFKPAKIMLNKTPELVEAFELLVNASNIAKLEDGAKFEPLIGNPGDGGSPSCYLCDEYHEHKDDAQYSTMRTGMGARRQPLIWIITTAGFNIAGPCYDKQLESQAMLEGTIPNEELFALIYTVDDEDLDNWDDPKVLAKANPNLGVSVSEEALLSEQLQAKRIASRASKFKTKHLNVWVSAAVAWTNMIKWRQCADSELDIEDFKGEEAYWCLDLASKLDILAYIRLFRRIIDRKVHYYCFSRFYIPEESVENSKQNKAAYERWVEQGFLQTMQGAENDFDELEEEIKELSSGHNVVEAPFDRWRAGHLMQRLDKQGMNTVEMPQGYQLNDGMRELEAAMASGRFHHDNNPVMNWMAANLKSMELKGRISPTKEKTKEHLKIDGMVALIQGVQRAMLFDQESGKSIYEESDVLC